MTVRLKTGASVTAKKGVMKITFTLKEVQYNDEFIVLDLDDNFMSSSVYRGLVGMIHKSADINEQSICLPLVHQTDIL